MGEPVTYEDIMNEDRARGARRLAIRLGTPRFGASNLDVMATLNALTDSGHWRRSPIGCSRPRAGASC
jgi:hypothetical protein